jgi:hypothetical protein
LTNRAPEQRAVRFGRAAPLLALTAVLALPAEPLPAQGVRGQATTTVRYISLRPIERASVPRTAVQEVDGRFFFDGFPVECLPGAPECFYFRPADVAHGVVATQDISGTAWGLGIQGLSATFLVRARANLDGDFVWPQSDDPFDAILGYAQLQRSNYRIRAGRQRTLSGLGFSGFDGLEVAYDPLPWLRAEAYGGRSLARGLHEPRHEALRAIEPFILDQNAYLGGAFVQIIPATGTSVGLRYQREIWANRIGLISERASVDVRSDLGGVLGPVRMYGALDWDGGFNRIGKAHLTVRSPLPAELGWIELTGRRYLPYFEMSTIWGFFSPTPYHEAEARATVRPARPVTTWASVGWRKYGDPEITVIGPPITDESTRIGVGARWVEGDLSAFGEYRLELGFGAVLSSGDVELRWQALPGLALSARGSAFQQIEQFRVGENVVVGGGLGADVALPARLRLRSGVDLYRQQYENRPSQADWNQIRAFSVLTVPFGQDPGARVRP